MINKHELAGLLAEIAVYLELKGENRFKIRAYQAAARSLEELTAPLDDLLNTGKIDEVKGIGKTMVQHIKEYAATGRIAYHEELKMAIPAVLFELVKIPGLGAKKALALQEKLDINSIGELEYACRENRLSGLAGFGEKTQQKILQGIEYLKKFHGHLLLCDAWPLADKIAEYLRSHAAVAAAQTAGSIRRRKETVKDIDIVVAADEPAEVNNIIGSMPGVEHMTAEGSSKITIKLSVGMKMDIHLVPPEAYACALHRLTGSKEHYAKLRQLAESLGYKINANNVEHNGRILQIRDEHELYHLFDLKYIPPELREGFDEIEQAAAGTLPNLVEEKDITGVLHTHTVYSDGAATIEAMAAAARARGWQYLGVTDHSQTAVYARGLKVDALRQQRREIDAFNANSTDFTILAGIESDILPDGSLDYPDDVLAQFDFVVASVHSAFRMSEAEMTKRIITAMENKYVSILGHATGRILLARPGYEVNMLAIIAAAANNGTMLEINASPYRLDIDWHWCRKAASNGVMIAINPDAHAVKELDYMRYGVALARKGWLSAQDIVNTRSVNEVRALLRRKQST